MSVLQGYFVWRKCRKKLVGENARCFIFPETDREVNCIACATIKPRDVIICTRENVAQLREMLWEISEKKKCEKPQIICLTFAFMEALLQYFRTYRDVWGMLIIKRLYIISFREAGTETLEGLYKAKFFPTEYLVKKWILNRRGINE